MPKEVIQHGKAFTRDALNDTVGPTLQVSWWRDGTDGLPGYATVQFEIDETLVAAIAENNATKISSRPLDRKEINKLIATLRRARDAAYGSDE